MAADGGGIRVVPPLMPREWGGGGFCGLDGGGWAGSCGSCGGGGLSPAWSLLLIAGCGCVVGEWALVWVWVGGLAKRTEMGTEEEESQISEAQREGGVYLAELLLAPDSTRPTGPDSQPHPPSIDQAAGEQAGGSMGGLDARTAGSLIGKGIGMGIIHVLTGG